jgi:hypothetical protein
LGTHQNVGAERVKEQDLERPNAFLKIRTPSSVLQACHNYSTHFGTVPEALGVGIGTLKSFCMNYVPERL